MKPILTVLLATIMLFSAAACGTGNREKEDVHSDMVLSAKNEGDVSLEAPEYGQTDAAAQTVAKGANQFALRLTGALLTENRSKNFVCSPYSVWLPLAALLNASDESARTALLKVLDASGVTAEDVNRASSRMLYDLNKERDRLFGEEYGQETHNPLAIANAVFVDQDATLNDGFARIFHQDYLGQAMNVDFSSPDAVRAVNDWANQHTEGLIKEIVQSFHPETVAALASAIYFSDRWSWEFDPEETQSSVFHGPEGDTDADYMLRQGDELSYFEDEQLQATPLRFLTGGGLLILLPKDGDAVSMLCGMDESYFREILDGMRYSTGKLLLPKFSIQSDAMKLNDVLTSLGVTLFDRENAHLTGLIQGSDAYLTDAVQKAVIQVDEKGTTAAAVTVMAAAGASLPIPTEPFEMICDRPFAFILYDQTYDGGEQILFTGVVNQPEA